MDEAITLLNDDNTPHGIVFGFDPYSCSPRIMMSLHDKNNRDLIATFSHDLGDPDEWNQFGKAIGCSTSLRRIDLRGLTDGSNNRTSESDQSMEAIYRGIERNCSIEDLKIDTDLIVGNGTTLPKLNLNDAQFKTSIKHFTVSGSISEGISFVISSFIENILLESFNMAHVEECAEEISESDFEWAFVRIVSACTKVKKLHVYCKSASQYAEVASLLMNPRSVLSEMDFCGRFDNAEGLSTIAAGLARNKTLEILRSRGFEGNLRPIAKALCDASSIKRIHASNHTLQKICRRPGETMPLMPQMIKDCLKLNKTANKNEVIRNKIARYYFIGDFDMSPFIDMPVSVLPEVLNLIEEDDIYRQSAIFRMLKTIPELCNVSSRDVRYVVEM
eukprot:scaffold88504_cov41-Cyclotella_meneghiniana.AAC.1